MPLDKFNLYVESSERIRKRERSEFVFDVAGAVAGSFGKEGIKPHLEFINEEKDGD